MHRHAARAIPWGAVVAAACLVAVLMELVRWNPGALWSLQGTAVGLLAGTSALCFDERAAGVVDTLSRTLMWRTAARAAGPALLAATWTVVVLHAGDDSLFGRSDQILAQGWVAVLAGAAVACWARSGGAATPGVRVMLGVVPLAMAWSLVRVLDSRLPVFPFVTESPAQWRASAVLWAAAGLAATVLLVLALTDARWWGTRTRRHLPVAVRERSAHSSARDAGSRV